MFRLTISRIQETDQLLEKSGLLKLGRSSTSAPCATINTCVSDLNEYQITLQILNPPARHNNAGPKFAINLLGRKVRATRHLSSDSELDTFCDILHVPTPWHGCIVEIQGHSSLYITKAHFVMEALSRGFFTGGWQSSKESHGGYFRLLPAQHLQRSLSSSEDTKSIASANTEDEKAGRWIPSLEEQTRYQSRDSRHDISISWLRRIMSFLCIEG